MKRKTAGPVLYHIADVRKMVYSFASGGLFI